MGREPEQGGAFAILEIGIGAEIGKRAEDAGLPEPDDQGQELVLTLGLPYRLSPFLEDRGDARTVEVGRKTGCGQAVRKIAEGKSPGV